MNFMDETIAQHTNLDEEERHWLALLVQQWDILSDLSFSDLILWVPDVDDNVFWAAAQIRPNTGPTALEEDVLGEDIAYDPEHLVTQAYLTGEIANVSDGRLGAGIPVSMRAIPIHRKDRCIAVVEIHTNRMGLRAPGALEDNYLKCASLLVEMIQFGRFPYQTERFDPWFRPRVGDGSLRIDSQGLIGYVSPNAFSAYRKLGGVETLLGESFWRATMDLKPEILGDDRDAVLENTMKNRPSKMELQVGASTVLLWALPLRAKDLWDGALILVRDISEVRLRERQLDTKDATIREIHHRVKNNLQTVAALLRMQARRAPTAEAKSSLEEAMRRVGAIAVVHQILSQSYDEAVNFDEIADKLLGMVGDLSATTGSVSTEREGTFGKVPADMANSLSLVLTELCQNAVEHGFASASGRVMVRPIRAPGELIMEVVNDGERLPEGFDVESSSGLGLNIVSTLVSDLGGSFVLTRGSQDKTVARVRLPLPE